MPYLAKYDTACTLQGIPLQSTGTSDLLANPTLASGDVQIDKDGAGFANIEGVGVFGDFVDVYPAADTSVRIRITAAQLQCKTLTIRFIDAAGVEWEDRVIIVETYGHASSQHPTLGV